MNEMKKVILNIAMLATMGIACSGCIDESFPNDDYVTEDQVDQMASGMDGLVNAIAGHLGMSETYGSYEFDLGYAGLGMIRDVLVTDVTIYSPGYDYFYYWASDTYLGGNYSTAYFPWGYYYKWIEKSNIILRKEFKESNKVYFGMAHFYRAWAYFDLARMYEFKKTGVSSLDQQAEANGIYGQTVPIIRENTTEAEARNTPRAMFYDMYRFILDDLTQAEAYLADYRESDRKAHNIPDISVVHGLMARFYLELGTRFELAPADLSTYQSSGVDLGIASAKDAYAKAASYAERAIAASSSTPLNEDRWFGGSGYSNGFNSASDWMLGALVSKEIMSTSEWRNFIGHMSPEQYYGVGGISFESATNTYTNAYGAQRIIDRSLYDQISDTDWRKLTWLNPADEGKSNGGKYKTSVTDGHFKMIPAYASFKFRPKENERSDYSVSAAADYPLMRIEEMFFIQAEALAASQGVAAGEAVLETLMATRDANYTCNATSLATFRKELMLQKRIEFWGEGILYWDYKRLNLQVMRGYIGTNSPTSYRLNSIDGYCAPWFNFFIPIKEYGMNTAMKANPDPSGSIDPWEE